MSSYSKIVGKCPRVSVVIPCYNHDQFVQESIQSVIDQDYKNIELIIIDDGSNDDSVSKILEMTPICSQRFQRFEFRNRPNKGLSVTLNEALSWCEGEYVSCLASDDLIKSFKISFQVSLLQNNASYIGVFGGIDILYRDGSTSYSKGISQSYNFEQIFKHEFCLPAPTQLLRLSKVMEVGGFREGFIIEDWIMWLDLTKNGGVLYYDSRSVASYRRHDGNISGQLDRMLEGRLQVLSEFKYSEYYKEAESNLYMVHGFDMQIFNKLKSIQYFVKSISIMPSKIFTRKFIVFIVKLFIKRKNQLG